MKNIRNISAILIVLLLTVSCEKDVDFNGKEPAPKMVINSIINGTSTEHTLKLSESVFLFGDSFPEAIDNPTLNLKVSGKDVPLVFLRLVGTDQYYTFNSPLVSGDKLEIYGKSLKHGEVFGEDEIPFPVELKDLQTEWFIGKNDDRSYLRTRITIKDKPNEKNYYRVIVRSKDYHKSDPISEDQRPWQLNKVLVDQEILFNNIGGILGESENSSRYRIFTDDLFENKEYTLNVYVQKEIDTGWGEGEVKRSLKVEIHSLSENLFKYLQSLELAMTEDNFSEPVKIHSNIHNGYGTMGSYNIADKMVILY